MKGNNTTNNAWTASALLAASLMIIGTTPALAGSGGSGALETNAEAGLEANGTAELEASPSAGTVPITTGGDLEGNFEANLETTSAGGEFVWLGSDWYPSGLTAAQADAQNAQERAAAYVKSKQAPRVAQAQHVPMLVVTTYNWNAAANARTANRHSLATKAAHQL